MADAPPIKAGLIQRLGKNLNGYFGETIDAVRVLQECLLEASRHGWNAETLDASPKPSLLALSRPALDPTNSKRIYISAGIHGDEPAGPLAALTLLRDHAWNSRCSISVLPCLNPTGFALKRRENDEGTDLNRQYLQPKAEETRAHIRWLERQEAFDLCLCLHEDWEAAGFYVYELNPDNRPSLANAVIEAAKKNGPIDNSELIEGRPAKNGIIRPVLDPRMRPQWPESFYLVMHKTKLLYTLEAASDFPLAYRAQTLVSAVNAALGVFMAQ